MIAIYTGRAKYYRWLFTLGGLNTTDGVTYTSLEIVYDLCLPIVSRYVTVLLFNDSLYSCRQAFLNLGNIKPYCHIDKDTNSCWWWSKGPCVPEEVIREVKIKIIINIHFVPKRSRLRNVAGVWIMEGMQQQWCKIPPTYFIHYLRTIGVA